jgi:hypothetical protein
MHDDHVALPAAFVRSLLVFAAHGKILLDEADGPDETARNV